MTKDHRRKVLWIAVLGLMFSGLIVVFAYTIYPQLAEKMAAPTAVEQTVPSGDGSGDPT